MRHTLARCLLVLALGVATTPDAFGQAKDVSGRQIIVGPTGEDTTATGNPVRTGGVAIADGAVTATTAGRMYNVPEDTQRRVLVRDYHPNFATWDTGAATVTATTQIATTSGGGLSYYITDIMLSNGATAQTVAVVSSTTAGNACATSPTSVIPPVSLSVNGGYAVSRKTPIKVTANSALCCKISGSTAFSCQLSGFIAP